MSGSTGIEWTDATWNPVTGCTRVSPGCAHCYIERTPPFRMAGRRFELVDGEMTTGVTLHPDRIEQPLKWRKPRRVFVNSLSDLFHEEIPYDFITQAFLVMAQANQHVFQVLTKRPERVLPWMRECWYDSSGQRSQNGGDPMRLPPNVWLGVSVENSRYTWRADVLREIPAAVRFLSCEPLLGSLFEGETEEPTVIVHNEAESRVMRALMDSPAARAQIDRALHVRKPLDLTGIDWVIVGGESGPKARPMHPDWAREIRDACHGSTNASKPAFFFKQWGEWAPWSASRGDLRTVPRGRRFRLALADGSIANEADGGIGTDGLYRIGKKAAGRELDRRTWDEFPTWI